MPSELSNEQIKDCKQALLDRKKSLRDDIQQELLKQDNENYIALAGTVHNLEEESFADMLVDINLADIDRHIEEDRDIGTALLRIEDGSYGTCIQCNGPIAIERLQAYPTAKRCLVCQTRHEQTHRSQEVHTL